MRYTGLLFPIGTTYENVMIATIGEALVDLIEQPDGRFEACLGGSVCNFTIGLARQGVATVYLNPLSEDRFGKRFAALLQDSGVSLSQGTASACPTALAIISLDAHGAPTYAFHREGVADRDISAEMLIAGFPEQLELLHTGGLALVPEDIEKILATTRAAINRGAIVSIDANMRPMVVRDSTEYVKGVRRAMAQSHIVKVSAEDLDILGIDSTRLEKVSAALFAQSTIELIVLTQGADGAALLTRTCQVALPAPTNLAVVDTVGAGDCFHAGLIAYLQRAGKLATTSLIAQLEHDQLLAALRHAMAAASLNIMRSGCNPATWEETILGNCHNVASEVLQP